VTEEFTGSCLLCGGQFCTNPGLVVLIAGDETERFIAGAKQKFESAAPPPLLSPEVARSLAESVRILRGAGAELVTTEGRESNGRYPNTLLRVTGEQFLRQPEVLQTEAFGSAALLAIAKDRSEAAAIIEQLEGNLTGSIYSDSRGSDDALYEELAPRLRARVGRLLNDKMPTGVAVSPGMNHGGPFPATGHPGFTAVGIPASLRRFAALHCYDNVRPERLPLSLADANPNRRMWRFIDGQWTQESCNLVTT
jgi:NADP-dependent aldehyde dehydrogenase